LPRKQVARLTIPIMVATADNRHTFCNDGVPSNSAMQASEQLCPATLMNIARPMTSLTRPTTALECSQPSPVRYLPGSVSKSCCRRAPPPSRCDASGHFSQHTNQDFDHFKYPYRGHRPATAAYLVAEHEFGGGMQDACDRAQPSNLYIVDIISFALTCSPFSPI